MDKKRLLVLTLTNSTKAILVACTLSPRSLKRETYKDDTF
jgi:hypothetical protein